MSGNATDNSTGTPASSNGAIFTAITILTFTTGTLANGLLFSVFVATHALRTAPFNTYLMNLLLGNLLNLLVQFPIDIATGSGANWYLPDPFCNLYLCAMWISQVRQKEQPNSTQIFRCLHIYVI